jgi:hypothetical protein
VPFSLGTSASRGSRSFHVDNGILQMRSIRWWQRFPGGSLRSLKEPRGGGSRACLRYTRRT